MDVSVVVHPVDRDAHPHIPEGYRWAVHVGSTDWADIKLCANAGWAPDLATAIRLGDANGASATRALRLIGALGWHYGVPTQLDHDPIPPHVTNLSVS